MTYQEILALGQQAPPLGGQSKLYGPNSSYNALNQQGATTGTASANYAPGLYSSNFASLYPNLTATQTQGSANILNQLQGQLSPETINQYRDEAARWGTVSGSPMSEVAARRGALRMLGGQEAQKQSGWNNYLNTLRAYSGSLMPTTGEVLGAETSRYGTDVGASTSRYGTDVAANTAANALGEQARQFGLTFPENQRQFDIERYLQNQQFQAGLGQNYLNSYLSFLS